MNREEIKGLLPHREPMLLVDELELGQDGTAHGKYRVRGDEFFLQGHFPGHPIMPGVLIAEALAQVGAFIILSNPEFRNKYAVFTGIDGFRFKHQVTPGDQLRLEVELLKFRSVMGKASACAYVGDKVAAKGEISFALVDKEG